MLFIFVLALIWNALPFIVRAWNYMNGYFTWPGLFFLTERELLTFETWDRWDIWSKLWLEVSLVVIAFQRFTLLRLMLLIGHSFSGDFLRGLQERHMGGVQLGGGEPRHPLATIHLRRELFVKLMWRLTAGTLAGAHHRAVCHPEQPLDGAWAFEHDHRCFSQPELVCIGTRVR